MAARTERQRIIAAAIDNDWAVRPRGRVYVFRKDDNIVTVGFDEDGAIVTAIVNGTEVIRAGRVATVIAALRGRVR